MKCRALARGRSARLALVVLGLAPGGGASGQSTCNVAHLTPSDGQWFNSFGSAVAVSGNTAVAGAPYHAHNGPNTGAAYVFAFDGRSWGQTQELLPSDGQSEDKFGTSVAIDGEWAMVATEQAPYGSVYAFRFDGTNWIEQQKLFPFDGQLGDGFASSIALDGEVAVIGAPGDDDNGAQSGSGYVFRLLGTFWAQEEKLLASDGAANDFFGYGVAVSGDVAVIGAPLSTDARGAAYVFRFDGADWVQEQKLLASGETYFDLFGEVVSVSGNVALIAVPSDDDNGSNSGSAYMFQFDEQSSMWLEVQQLLASDGSSGDQFGSGVAIDGDAALVGAFANDVGAAYVFRANQGIWLEQDQLLPEPGPWTAFFGQSVALSGDTAVIGALGEDSQTGAAYVFAGLSGTDCNATGMADSCDVFLGLSQDANGDGIPDVCECPWDLDASGAVGITDFLALLRAWGSNAGGPPDFDGDGAVGILDFLVLLANWGPCV